MARLTFYIGRFLLCLLLMLPCSTAAQETSLESDRKVVSRVVPTYPQLARTIKLGGTVRLQALVAPNGTVKSVKVFGGHPVLVEAAERAVYKWRWERVGHDSNESIELKFNPE